MPKLPGRILLIAIALSAAGGSARAQPVAPGLDRATLVIDGYELFVHLAPPSTPYAAVDAAVYDALGNPRFSAEAVTEDDGSARFAFVSPGVSARRHPLFVRAGDRVVVRRAPDRNAPPGTEPVVLGEYRGVAFTAEADGPSGVVSGTAPPGSDVAVLRQRSDGGVLRPVHARADAGGRWRAAIGEGQPLAAGSHGVAYYGDGDVTVQHVWVVPDFRLALGTADLEATVMPGEIVKARLVRGLGSAERELAEAQAAAWEGSVWLKLRDADGHEVHPEAGDRLLVSSSLEPSREVEIPSLHLDLDPATDAIRGRATPGQPVRIRIDQITEGSAASLAGAACGTLEPRSDAGFPDDNAQARPGVERMVTADAGGRFVLDLAGTYDVTPATRVVAAASQRPGVSLTAFAPSVTAVDPLEAQVAGRGPAGEVVSATLTGPGGEVRARAMGRVAGNGAFDLRLSEPGGQAPVLLRAGDRLKVAIGAWSAEADARPFHVRSSAGQDRVSGRAAPGDRVEVTLTGGVTAATKADALGDWTVDFAGRADLRPGTRVTVRTADGEGGCRALDFVTTRVTVQVDTDRVRVEGAPGLTATLQAKLGLRDHGSGQCTVVRDACDAPIRSVEGRQARLTEGDVVEAATSDGERAVVEVAQLDAHVDPTGNGVTGGGPPNMPLRLELFNASRAGVPLDSVSSTNELGDYDFMFSTADVPLTVPGLIGDVFVGWPSGHELWARGLVEQIHITLGEAELRGLAEPGTRVDGVFLPSDRWPVDGLDANDSTTADADGHFALHFANGAGAPQPVTIGQRLLVAHRRRQHELTVPKLAAWPVDGTGTLAGFTLPGLAVKAIYTLKSVPVAGALTGVSMPQGDGSHTPRERLSARRLIAEALVDPSGTFVIDPPPVDARLVLTREVVATLPHGEEVGLVVPSGPLGGRLWLPAVAR